MPGDTTGPLRPDECGDAMGDAERAERGPPTMAVISYLCRGFFDLTRNGQRRTAPSEACPHSVHTQNTLYAHTRGRVLYVYVCACEHVAPIRSSRCTLWLL